VADRTLDAAVIDAPTGVATAPPPVPFPVLPPHLRAERLPRRACALPLAAVAAVLGSLLPWFSPSGQVAADTPVPAGDLYSWQLVGLALAGVAGLVVTAGVAVLRLRRPRGGVPAPRRAPARVVGRLGMTSASAVLLGAYLDWRALPATVGVGREAWDAAGYSGVTATAGAQPALWLVVTAALVALLVSASLLGITLRVIALAYLGGLVLLPVYTVVLRAFASGAAYVWEVVTSDPEFLHAVQLTAVVAGIAVLLNTVFGLGVALLLTRYEFPGRRALSLFIDLPLAISPVVVGVALMLVYGQTGWFGAELAAAGFPIIFSVPGMVLATVIVALPLVVREIVPVLEEAGVEQEQAAQSLGASAWQRFRRITVPTIKWALAYGVVLSLARSIGEFGAVRVVSQSVALESQTVTLFINREYEQLGTVHKDNAFIGSFVLMVVAVIFIVVIAVLRPKDES
jgi:sulfate transport system permease protein